VDHGLLEWYYVLVPIASHGGIIAFMDADRPLGGPHAPGILYGGSDETLFSSDMGAPSGATPALFDAHPRDEAYTQAAPLYYKLEFPTYDGLQDPLNWLNQCEQFFSDQHTSPTDYTWLATYHFREAAQTWYFTLVQYVGWPTFARFKELCNLQFSPPVRGSRLAELGRIQFTSTVQDYTERLCGPLQRPEP
jgi:hypothetical protein